jgi:hypothetical protein
VRVVLAVTKADIGAFPTKFKTYRIGDDFRECKIWEVARTMSGLNIGQSGKTNIFLK